MKKQILIRLLDGFWINTEQLKKKASVSNKLIYKINQGGPIVTQN